MGRGWFKVSRGINAWRWRKHPATLSVWLWLLSHADNDGRALWREAQVCADCGLTRREAQTALKHLTSAPAEIVLLSSSRGAKTAQVLGWEEYQYNPKSIGTKNAQKRDEKGTKNAQKRDKEKFLEAVEEWKLANGKK